MDSILRVASRAMTAGFIPDKFWKTKVAELKKLMATAVKSPEDVRFEFSDKVLPFYKKFEQDLIEFGMHRFAEESVRSRFDTMRAIVERIGQSHGNFHKATYTFPHRGPLAEVISALELEIHSAYSDKFKTMGHAFKATWFTESSQVEALAKRLLSKATPAEMDALEKVANDDWGSALQVKYTFLQRVNAKAQALKLVKKEKVTWDPFSSIEMLQGVLKAVFSEEAGGPEQFTEFDLHGMKVVVDDQSVTEDQIKKYVGYLKEAHALLRTKGFAKVWYGTTFISCQECGGINYNTGGGTGGHYSIGKDWVKVFVRPSQFVVELMVHELGHRHWFKGMSSEQRARFHSLVKTHEGRNPEKVRPKLIPATTVQSKKEALSRMIDPLLESLSEVVDAIEDNRTPGASSVKRDMAKHDRALDHYYEISINLVPIGGDLIASRESMTLLTEYTMLGGELQEALTDGLDKVDAMGGDPAENLEDWERATYKLAEKLKETGFSYLDTVSSDHNRESLVKSRREKEEIEEAWKADSRQVMPVSDYGASNIDEAFAEVFMKYVMGEDLNRDQLESFKTVFGSFSDPQHHAKSESGQE